MPYLATCSRSEARVVAASDKLVLNHKCSFQSAVKAGQHYSLTFDVLMLSTDGRIISSWSLTDLLRSVTSEAFQSMERRWCVKDFTAERSSGSHICIIKASNSALILLCLFFPLPSRAAQCCCSATRGTWCRFGSASGCWRPFPLTWGIRGLPACKSTTASTIIFMTAQSLVEWQPSPRPLLLLLLKNWWLVVCVLSSRWKPVRTGWRWTVNQD